MVKSQRGAFRNNYLAALLTWMMVLVCGVGWGQTYNPTAHIPINEAISPVQATPLDSRSMFWDAFNFKYRDYQNTGEVLSYLNLSKYRAGGTPIFVHLGGSLSGGVWTGGIRQVWFFKNGTADSNLVRWYTDSTGCSGCMIGSNNLSELTNAAAARANLGLGQMALLGITAGGDLSGFYPNPTVAKFNGQLPAYYLNYNNLTNLPTIPAQVNLIAGAGIGITGTYPNLTISSTGGVTCLNCNADTIRHLFVDISANRNGWLLGLDTVTGVFRLYPPDTAGGGGGGITHLNALTASTQTFAIGTAGSDFNIVSSVATHTFNFPTASAINRGLLSPTDWSTFNGKLSNITGLVSAGTNVTITGSGTNVSPYVINSSGGGGSIPPNVGSGLAVYSPQIPGLRRFTFTNGLVGDSTTTSQSLTVQVDTSRMIHSTFAGIRNRVPDYPLESIYMDGQQNGGIFYYDNTDVTTADDSVMTFVTPTGKRWKRWVTLPNQVNVAWFTAAAAYGDASYPINKAIQWCVNNPNTAQIVYFPAGTYNITKPIQIINFTGTTFNQVTVSLLGATSQKDHSTGLVQINCANTNQFAIAIQKGKDCFIKNLQINGQYTRPNSFSEITVDTASPAFWWDGVVRNNTTTPYAGIVIDPYCDSLSFLSPSDRYPGLDQYYQSGLGRSGSSAITMENLRIENFWVAEIVTPSTNANGEMIYSNNIQYGANYTEMAVTQAQTKENIVRNFMAWEPTHCIFDNSTFGFRHPDGGGTFHIYGGNIAGSVYQITNIYSGVFPSSFDDTYGESFFKIGICGGFSGVSFSNCDFNFASDETFKPYPDFFVSGINVNFYSCQARMYNPNIHRRVILSGVGGKWWGGVTNEAPIIANLNPNISLYTPEFEHVMNYYGVGYTGGLQQSQVFQGDPNYLANNGPVYPGKEKWYSNLGAEYTREFETDYERKLWLGNYVVTTGAPDAFHGRFYGATLHNYIKAGDVILTQGVNSTMENMQLCTHVVGFVDSVSATDTIYMSSIANGIVSGTTYNLVSSYYLNKSEQFMGTVVANSNQITNVRTPVNGVSIPTLFPIGYRFDNNGLFPNGTYITNVVGTTITMSNTATSASADSSTTHRFVFENGSPIRTMRSAKRPEKWAGGGQVTPVYSNSTYYYSPFSVPRANSNYASQSLGSSEAEIYKIGIGIYQGDTTLATGEPLKYEMERSQSSGSEISYGTTAQLLTNAYATKAIIQANTDSNSNSVAHMVAVLPGGIRRQLAYSSEVLGIPGNGYLKVVGGVLTNLTAAAVTADLSQFSSSVQGVVPSFGANSGYILSTSGWIPPPAGLTTFWTNDGTITTNGIPRFGLSGGRTANFNNLYFALDSVKYTSFFGGPGLPTMIMDLSNSGKIYMNSTQPWFLNQNFTDSGKITQVGSAVINDLQGQLSVGGNASSMPSGTMSQFYSATSYAVVTNITNSNSTYSGYEFRSPAGITGSMYAASTASGLGFSIPNRGFSIFANIGYLTLGTINSSQKVVILAGGSAAANEVGRFSAGLFQMGDTAAYANHIFHLTSTTKQSQPWPTMTNTQMLAVTGTEGGAIYDLTNHVLNYYNGSAWTPFGSGAGNLQAVLTAGATLTTTNTITNTGQLLTFANGGTGTIKFTGLRTDSVGTLGVYVYRADSSVARLNWTDVMNHLPAFNLYFANGLTTGGGDSVYLGGPLNQPTSIAIGSFSLAMTSTVGGITISNATNGLQTSGVVSFSGWNVTTSTGSVTVSGAQSQPNYLDNPASSQTSFTFEMPTGAVDGQVVNLFFGGTIANGSTVASSFSVTTHGGSGTVVFGAAVASPAVAGDHYTWKYYATGNAWYRQ